MDGEKHHFDDCRYDLEKCKCDLKRYWKVSKISLLFILPFQVTGSLLSGSLALLADTLHVAIDALGSLLNVVIEYFVVIRRLNKNRERWLRITGGLISAALLFLIAFWIGAEALKRMADPPKILSWLMLGTAIIGGVANFWQYWILKRSASTHITQESAEKHVWSDLSQSFAVVLGGLIVVAGYPIGDPLISLIVALNILRFALSLVRNACKFQPS